jgi:hypothetical protein
MKSTKLTVSLSTLLSAILLAGILGCGGPPADDITEGECEECEDCDCETSSATLSALESLTNEVNNYVVFDFRGGDDASEIETVMAGFTNEYAALGDEIEKGNLGEADEFTVSLAKEGEEKVAALGVVLAANPGTIDYANEAVVEWGEYSDKVYNAVADDPALSDPDNTNYKGIGKGQGKGQGRMHGKGKGLDKGYGWWKNDAEDKGNKNRNWDDEQYRERERERERDGECEGTPKHDGSGKGKGKGKGSGSGKGGGKGKGY